MGFTLKWMMGGGSDTTLSTPPAPAPLDLWDRFLFSESITLLSGEWPSREECEKFCRGFRSDDDHVPLMSSYSETYGRLDCRCADKATVAAAGEVTVDIKGQRYYVIGGQNDSIANGPSTANATPSPEEEKVEDGTTRWNLQRSNGSSDTLAERRSIGNKTAEQCFSTCHQEPHCKAFTFDAADAQGQCRLFTLPHAFPEWHALTLPDAVTEWDDLTLSDATIAEARAFLATIEQPVPHSANDPLAFNVLWLIGVLWAALVLLGLAGYLEPDSSKKQSAKGIPEAPRIPPVTVVACEAESVKCIDSIFDHSSNASTTNEPLAGFAFLYCACRLACQDNTTSLLVSAALEGPVAVLIFCGIDVRQTLKGFMADLKAFGDRIEAEMEAKGSAAATKALGKDILPPDDADVVPSESGVVSLEAGVVPSDAGVLRLDAGMLPPHADVLPDANALPSHEDGYDMVETEGTQ
ncbi:hypothetical protein LTR36_008433 [Oleoguttula mirabilis]|uniref:Apple domain-containing protein n=1 Tax=Oleoguttula mirabilis TaxID=1507867 RepID=A0AAV9J7Z7_9PEZI|nr:hypothetical protein LTR36_008433 [Oleoguttula mirabilis]